MANVSFYVGSTVPTSSSTGTSGSLIVSTNNSTYGGGGLYYNTGSSILNIGKGVCVKQLTTAAATSSSTTDTYTFTHDTIGGIVLRIEGVQVGNTATGRWMPGIPTVTPAGGNYGATYKVSCQWTYKAPSGGALILQEYTYRVYYIPYN